MKLLLTLFVMLLGTLSLVAAQKAVIVRYPKGTPKSAIEAAMRSVQKAGGTVRPLFFINAFSAKGPESALALNEITTQSQGYTPTIEDDGIMTIQGQKQQNI